MNVFSIVWDDSAVSGGSPVKTVVVSEVPSHSMGMSETAEDVTTILLRVVMWTAASRTAIKRSRAGFTMSRS